MILALKTAGATTEISLLDDAGQVVREKSAEFGRELAEKVVAELAEISRDFSDLTGLIVFRGPGSFTGLRIGITVMNTLSYSLRVPIVGAMGENWLSEVVKKLKNGENDRIVVPKYGREARITRPKK
jgi:tRNA threonylcarbamoyladenosine biosynthesis protein TsaB